MAIEWSVVKQALDKAIRLEGADREAYLQELAKSEPELQSEVAAYLEEDDDDDDSLLLELPSLSGNPEPNPEGPTRDAATMEVSPSAPTRGDNSPTQHFDPVPDDDRTIDQGGLLPALNKGVVDPIQRIVGDKYDSFKKIGQGGMGAVYRAREKRLNRTVAIKVILKERLFSPMVVARFLVEAESVAKLEHPNIVQIYESGEHDGNYFYTMPYVEGQDLSKLISSPLTMPSPRRAVEIIEQVARAVQHAHDHAVIHRDIKPANIMLDKNGTARLTDFGLAKIMEENEASMKRPEVTTEGQIIGTPSYMSPEQAQGQLHRSNTWTDIYALGATLYALLSGNAPFAGKTHIETLRMVVETEAPRLTKAKNKIPVDLDTICEKCLRKEPTDRYRSAADLADDLRRWLDGYPISIRAATTLERTIRWARRNPVIASLTVATAASLLIGTIVSTLFGIEAQRQATVANANAKQTRKILEENVNFVSEGILAKEPGMQAARKAILENSLKEYETLLTTAEADGVAKRELAGTLFLVGKLRSELGQSEAAREALSRAAAIQNELLDSSPNDVELLTSASKSHNLLAKGYKQELDQLFRNKTPANENLKKYRNSWQQNSEAVTALRERAVEASNNGPEQVRLLANAYMNEGLALCLWAEQTINVDRATALESFNQGIDKQQAAHKLRETQLSQTYSDTLQRDYAKGFQNYAKARYRQCYLVTADEQRGHLLEKALDHYTHAIDAYLPLVNREQPAKPDARAVAASEATSLVKPPVIEIAICYHSRGDVHMRRIETKLAIADYLKATKYLYQLAESDPRVFFYQARLSASYNNLTQAYFNLSMTTEAIKAFGRCRAAMVQMMRISLPSSKEAGEHAANQYVTYTKQYADMLLLKNEAKASIKLLEESAKQLQRLAQESSILRPIIKYATQLEELAKKRRAEVEAKAQDKQA